ncbi:peroxisomal-coenzyme a synthetase [Diaporthe sp. PMI_573]|nr:peroxisomal-coenzyme a synthetase [Diaporthaceae sp. PMI_573]
MNIYSAVCSEVAGKGQDDSAVAVIDLARKEASVTYRQLKATVDSLRESSGIKAGENIVLVMPNSLDLVVALLAVWAQGAAAAPLNPSYTEHEFKGLVTDLGAKTALIRLGDHKSRDVLAQASPDVHIIEVDACTAASTSSGTGIERPVPCVVDRAQLEDRTALYLHTSGTTGKPKAVPLKQSHLVCGANNVAEAYSLGHTDRTYLVMVLFHIHGIVAGMLAPLTTGGSIVIPAALDGSRAWDDFTDNSCTWLTASPSILQVLLAAPCSMPMPKIRFLRSCSSPLLPTVFRQLRKRFNCPVLEAYAMTEASHQMCSNRPQDFAPGSVGSEVGSTKICIAVGGRACAPGTPGEVCVSGGNVFGGYEGVSHETNREAFWEGPDERGHLARWFRTGDIGVLSTDGRRRLTLVGRKSEMVNRGGEKISLVEVDEAIMAVPGVLEVASFAVPDYFFGQEIEAAVVLQKGSELGEADLRRALEKRLAPFKVPKRIHFCKDKIPKGACSVCLPKWLVSAALRALEC